MRGIPARIFRARLPLRCKRLLTQDSLAAKTFQFAFASVRGRVVDSARRRGHRLADLFNQAACAMLFWFSLGHTVGIIQFSDQNRRDSGPSSSTENSNFILWVVVSIRPTTIGSFVPSENVFRLVIVSWESNP